MLYYVLNKNLDGSKIIQDLNKLIHTIPNDQQQDTVVVISLQKITNCTQDSFLHKIEYKQQES